MSAFKEKIKKNKILKWPYKLLSNIKSFFSIKKQCAILKKNGNNILEKVCSFLSLDNIVFFIDMGSLLGIIREGHLLTFDKDIDIGIFVTSRDIVKKVYNSFTKNGCELYASYIEEKHGVVQLSFKLKETRIDANFYYNDSEFSKCYLFYSEDKDNTSNKFNVVELRCPLFDRTENLNYCSFLLPVPLNPEKYLENRYGEKWKIPDKHYVYWKGPSACKIDSYGIVLNANDFEEWLKNNE